MVDSTGPRVLVVDDEKPICELIRDTLEDAGFAVQVATQGPAAIALLQEVQTFKALITDIDLRGPVPGWDVARAAREQQPAMAVVYITGTEGPDWTAQGVPGSILIEKPFAMSQIVTAVTTLLNAAPPAPSTD